MRQVALSLWAMVALGVPAVAAWDYFDTTGLANILVSEDLCGLTYDQDAIATWVDTNVPADLLDFPADLNGAIYALERSISGMGTSQVTAHCTQIKRLAKAYNFTP